MGTVFRENPVQSLILTSMVSVNLIDIHINAQWFRWVHASINKHFEDRRGDYPLYLEGDERVESDTEDFAELRIDGPMIKNPHKGYRYLDVEINVLLQSVMDPKNMYKVQEIVGLFSHAFTNLINVNKYGNGPLDDDSLLGCFHLQRDKKEGVVINYFGIIRQDTRITQATIEGHYRLEL